MLRNNLFEIDDPYRQAIRWFMSNDATGEWGVHDLTIMNNTFRVLPRDGLHQSIIAIGHSAFDTTNIYVYNNLFVVDPGFDNQFLSGGASAMQVRNNVYPDFGPSYEYCFNNNWSSWTALPYTDNEARETVPLSAVVAPDYRPSAGPYPVATTNGRPEPGNFMDYHTQPRPIGDGVTWYTGVADQ